MVPATPPCPSDVSTYLPMFLAEAREHLQQLNLAVVRVEEVPHHRATVDRIFRIAHSLKAMSATMGFAAMATLTHEMEDVFELLRQRRNGLSREAIDVLLECLDGLEATVDGIERDGAEGGELQTLVVRLRMTPVESALLRLPRLVRDVSSRLGKEVDLVLKGMETELDRTVVEALGDPLVHLVRNSLDHGLERPEERVAVGKPARGTLEVAARHADGAVVITVRDDGRGIDTGKVAAKAAERGLEAGAPDPARAVELIWEPGLSTAERTNDISGRGVGMDVVRTTIRDLGGEVGLTSAPGAGTTVSIRLPHRDGVKPEPLWPTHWSGA